MFILYTNFCLEEARVKKFSEKFQKSEAEMCLAMCLKKQEFHADCVYKLGVYKKNSVSIAVKQKVILYLSLTDTDTHTDPHTRKCIHTHTHEHTHAHTDN